MWKRMVVAVFTFLSLLENEVNGSDVYQVKNVNPPNGSKVIHVTGASNVTFLCELVFKSNGGLGISQWRLLNFGGDNSFQDVYSYRSELSFTYDGLLTTGVMIPNTRRTFTITSFIKALDQTTLGCFGEQIYSEFYLFIYRPPSFRDLRTTLKFVKGEKVVINLQGMEVPARPFPAFSWTVNGNPASSQGGVDYGYPSITFSEIQESHSGLYSLSANNYLLDGNTTVSGMSTANFSIEVLFGPFISHGVTVRAVREGGNISLFCGNQILSNPQAVVTWLDPMLNKVLGDGTNIVNSNNGSRINLYAATESENGTWTCNVTVAGINVTDPETLEILPIVQIGAEQFEIELIVVVAPSQNLSIVVLNISATWAHLSWDPPAPSDKGYFGAVSYIVTAVDPQGNIPNIVSTTSELYINVTNLLPRINFQFHVQAVASALGVDNPGTISSPINVTTLETVPAFSDCSISSTSGGITISFAFLHTGGLPLTSLNVTYIFNSQVQGVAVNVLISDRSVTIPSLVAGFSYTAVVGASNVEGTTSIDCPVFVLYVGIPQKPEKPEVTEMGDGEVMVNVRTLNPGMVGSGDVYFVLTITMLLPSGSSGRVNELRKDDSSYASGDIVMFNTVLEVDNTYNFSVLVGNEYGMSTTNSITVQITGRNIATIPTSATTVRIVSAGRLVGGVIGGLIGLVVVCTFSSFIILVLLYRFKTKQLWYRPTGSKLRTATLSDKRVPDIGVDMNSSNNLNCGFDPISSGNEDVHYAELDNFMLKNPARFQSTQPRAARHDEPVMYATIDIFKKAPLDNMLTECDEKIGTSATVV